MYILEGLVVIIIILTDGSEWGKTRRKEVLASFLFVCLGSLVAFQISDGFVVVGGVLKVRGKKKKKKRSRIKIK